MVLETNFKKKEILDEKFHNEIVKTKKNKESFSSIYNKVRKLQLNNGKILETPITWYGLSVIESQEFHKEVFKRARVENFLSNAYDLYFQDKKQKRADLIKFFKKEGFLHKMDSGGFQLMKKNMSKNRKSKNINNTIELTPEKVFLKQLETGCDIAVQLDIPLSPNLSRQEQIKTINKSFNNFVVAKKLNDKAGNPLTIMPVVHGYDHNTLEQSISKVEEIIGEPKLIGIGSLVPMVKSMKGTNIIGGKWTFIDLLMYIRKRLPNTIIHAFGIGGTMSYLAYYIGIDSLDSNGWIQKSAYGVIQLPGVSDRFLTKKAHNRAYIIDERIYRKNGKEYRIKEKELLLQCQCPICMPLNSKYQKKDLLWHEKIKTFEIEGVQGRINRAIHNIWMFNKELELIKTHIKNKTLDKFIEKRLITSTYYNLFQYAYYLKHNMIKNAENIKNKYKIDNLKNLNMKLDQFLN